MPNIVLISGSPSSSSRSGALLETLNQSFQEKGFTTQTFGLRDFPAEDLILGKYDSPAFTELKRSIEESSGLVVSTPIYKAAYTGGLKALLDILPQSAFSGKTILPLATGGSLAHLLAIEYALKPVLSALGATDLLQGVYVTDKELALDEKKNLILPEELKTRLESSINQLATRVKKG